MFKVPSSAHPALRILAIAVSVGLLAYLVWHAGPANLWQELVKLSWGFALVIVLAGISHLAKTWAWQMTLVNDQHKISFFRLVGLRLGAEAAGQLGILGQTFGDSIRVSHLSREIQTANSLASVTLDRGFYLVTGIVVAIAGILAALPMLSISHALRIYAELFVLGSAAFLLLLLMTVRKRWPLLSGSARSIRGIPFLGSWIEKRFELIEGTESALFDFHHKTPKLFWGSFSLNLAGQCLAILEVSIVLWLLGAHVGFSGALITEALTKLVNAIGNFNPGNIGTYEGGNMLIGKIFSLSSTTAMALALARRLRAFFWTVVGGLCLVFLTRARKKVDFGGPEKLEATTQDTATPTDVPPALPSSSGATFAIFLTGAHSPLARVGTLPIVCRTILAAQKLHPARIIVVTDPATKESVQPELIATGRLPNSVQWIDEIADSSLPQRLHFAASQAASHRLVLIDGNTNYNPALIRQANEWNDEHAALELTSGQQFAGIYALPTNVLHDFGACGSKKTSLFEKLHASLAVKGSVVSKDVSKGLWQRVSSEQDRRVAEEKLDRWLVKPTDGMYAQLNRRISIPISRQIIKLPVTANMASIFTLGVGFCSAVFFALGGYWNTLLGAFLCLFASILDGCDGEVARLKLLESDFGCWLETVCDYVFYFFLLTGMTIGQWRTSGTKAYLLWGGLLLLGAVASFLAVGWQRHRIAASRPDQLLSIWQSCAEGRRSNPLLYCARHTEFILRRCFFPYALVVFALFNIMNVAFIFSVIGANLVWPIALYSSRTFAGNRISGTARRPAPENAPQESMA
jgi:phosphatidylglycerophosphate synthase